MCVVKIRNCDDDVSMGCFKLDYIIYFLYHVCDATNMYYLWHLLFSNRVWRVSFFLVLFFNTFLHCVLVMLVRSWLKPYIPLFIGVTSCIWGMAILVYHHLYDWCTFHICSRNFLLCVCAYTITFISCWVTVIIEALIKYRFFLFFLI